MHSYEGRIRAVELYIGMVKKPLWLSENWGIRPLNNSVAGCEFMKKLATYREN